MMNLNYSTPVLRKSVLKKLERSTRLHEVILSYQEQERRVYLEMHAILKELHRRKTAKK